MTQPGKNFENFTLERFVHTLAFSVYKVIHVACLLRGYKFVCTEVPRKTQITMKYILYMYEKLVVK